MPIAVGHRSEQHWSPVSLCPAKSLLQALRKEILDSSTFGQQIFTDDRLHSYRISEHLHGEELETGAGERQSFNDRSRWLDCCRGWRSRVMCVLSCLLVQTGCSTGNQWNCTNQFKQMRDHPIFCKVVMYKLIIYSTNNAPTLTVNKMSLYMQ